MNEDYLRWLNGSWKYPKGMIGPRLTQQQLDDESTLMGGRPIVSELDPVASTGIPMTGNQPQRFYVPPPGVGNINTAPKTPGKDYTQFGIAAGANVAGGLMSYLAADARLRELKNKGADLSLPPGLREYLAKTRMSAASSRTPNANRELARIANDQTAFNRNAIKGSTSSSQVLTAMGGGQQVAERARENLAMRGEEARRANERMYRDGLLTKSQYEANQRKLYQDSLAALYNAKMQSVGNTLTGVAQSALLAL